MTATTIAAMAEESAEAAGVHTHEQGLSVLNMVLHAGPVVQGIMAGLLVLSLICWAIMLSKTWQLRKVNRESEIFADLFMNSTSLGALRHDGERLREGHLAHIFRVGLAELDRTGRLIEAAGMKHPGEHGDLILENVDRAIQGGIISKRKRLQRMLPFLATTGSMAPFIGLFGTVWGIMTSFQDIGLKGSASLAVVAPGISEALVATAMGLAAAIPAVMAYNHFSNKIQVIADDMLQFSSDFLNRLKTDLALQTRQGAAASGLSGISREGRNMCGRMDGNTARTG